MIGLILILFFSAFGGTLILHYLKNFLLKEKIKLRLDWDGLAERALITFIIIAAPQLWIFIPFPIAAKAFYRFWAIGSSPGVSQSNEPGATAQKVLLKSDLAFDLLASPALAILAGVIFK